MIALLLDCETTGLIPNRSIKIDLLPEIIEFYGVYVDLSSGKSSKPLQTLIRPTKYPMSDKVIAETKTKITNDMLQSAPTFAEASNKIRPFIEKASIIIGHNISFDKEMLEIEFERLQQSIKWNARFICTVEQTIWIKSFRLSLTNLHLELFGEEFREAHRAGPDTRALLRCCREMYDRGWL